MSPMISKVNTFVSSDLSSANITFASDSSSSENNCSLFFEYKGLDLPLDINLSCY